MLLVAAYAVVSLALTTFLLVICLGRKKKNTVKTVSYSQRDGTLESANSEKAPADFTTIPIQQQSVQNGSEFRRPHSASTASRELPSVPVSSQEINSLHGSSTRQSDSISELSASGGSPEMKHHSPKGRRLPTPPPEDAKEVASQGASINVQNEIDDEDVYARVDDQPKADPVRLKIKTLNVPEGSGDSSFYAKVGDVVVEENDDLYAQVEDANQPKSSSSSKTSTKQPVVHSSGAVLDPNDSINYGNAEYASIDKLRKLSISKRPEPVSTEPPAPPIPERNFDTEDELDEDGEDAPDTSERRIEEAQNGHQEAGQDHEQGEDENQQQQQQMTNHNHDHDHERENDHDHSNHGPMYDKLCVRESLDHLRHRQEAEEERRQRYANIQRPGEGGAAHAANAIDVYAQIEELGTTEAVYESVHGSADGSFLPPSGGDHIAPNGGGAPPSNNPDYSSIQEISAPRENGAIDTPSTLHHPGNPRAERQHHYEQIERAT